jgi:hypothetical protein
MLALTGRLVALAVAVVMPLALAAPAHLVKEVLAAHLLTQAVYRL